MEDISNMASLFVNCVAKCAGRSKAYDISGR